MCFPSWRRSIMMLLLVFLSLFCGMISPVSAQTQEYILYSLKPFSVQVTSPSITPDAVLPIASIGHTIKYVTEKYLHDFLDATLQHDVNPIGGKLQGVSLQVSVKRSSQRHRHLNGGLTAELYGDVAFENIQQQSTMPSRDTIEAFLEKLLENAFTPPDLGIYQERLMMTGEPHLQQMSSMVVTTDFENRKPMTDTTTTSNTTDSNGKSKVKVAFVTILCVLMVSFVSVLLIRRRNHYKQQHKDHFYGSRNLACMAEQGMHHHHHNDDHGLQHHYNGRQTSLLSRFYQVAFQGSNSTELTEESIPHDDNVAIHHGHARAYDFQQEEDIVDAHIHRSGPYIEQQGGSLASWVRSTFPQRHSDRPSNNTTESIQFMYDANNPSKPFVYRDFPRHDGTPCLIYNSYDTKSQDMTLGNNKDLGISTVWAASTNHYASSQSPTNNPDEEEEEEEPVDSFVDRLEQLMVIRHEQYQERSNMERRRARTFSSEHDAILTIEQAEAALDDFLDLPNNMVSPTLDEGGVMTTPKANLRTSTLSYDNVLTDEKNIDSAMRGQRRRISWDEEDPTITGIMS